MTRYHRNWPHSCGIRAILHVISVGQVRLLAPWWWNLELLNWIMEGIPGSYYPNASVVVQWSVTMETGVTLGQVAPPWSPWWWNLELLNCNVECFPGSFSTNAPVVVQWSVTMETGVTLWDKWLLPGPPGGGIWNYWIGSWSTTQGGCILMPYS